MEDTLVHYGITGQKRGIRRYQNEDGSLTDAGRKRYSDAKKILNIQSKTTTSRLTDQNPSKKLVKAYSESFRSRNFNPLNVQTRTNRVEGIPLEEYNKQQNNKAVVKIKNISQSVIQNGKKVVEKILNTVNKAVTKIKDVSKQTISKIKNKVDKILNIQHKTTWKTVMSSDALMVKANEGSASSKSNISVTKEGSAANKRKKK